ncbi:MAG TPA: SGNH/GDSL hydrolase family protein [Chloroflexota bacterium]|nr:SGNH/GDSL hydrolase family protein [Chloroflexota bacterium]
MPYLRLCLLASVVLAFFLSGGLAGCGQSGDVPAVPTPFVTTQPALAAVNTAPSSGSGQAAPTPPPATNLPPSTPTAVPTRTLSPTPTYTPIPTETPTPLPTPTPTLPPAPPEVYVNGTAPGWFVLLPPETVQRSQEIWAQGQAAGRDPHRFSKIGDSIVDTHEFFTWFDEGNYDLGDYAYLQGVIDYFAGSYGRHGVALKVGLNSAVVTDPAWADKEVCYANESPLACEIRLNNPAILLIHFGTNDYSGSYEGNMREIVEYALAESIVPILITKANRIEGSNYHNNVLRQLAAEYHIPVWDFDVVAETLPGRGLEQDEHHMTFNQRPVYSSDRMIYTGYGAFNLTGLIVLDTFLREVIIEE